LRAKIDAHLQVSIPPVRTPAAAPATRSPVQPTNASTEVPSQPPIVVESSQNASEPPPPDTNDPEKVLDAWTALEVLSPFTYTSPADLGGGEGSCIATVSSDSLPWLWGRKSRPERRMYYQVVLGSLRTDPAVARLLERYGDSRPERPLARGRAALAVVILD